MVLNLRIPEFDPDGLDKHATGSKADAGKNRLGLVLGDFSRALQAVGWVGTFGAAKYTDSGWTEVERGQERYHDAELRHWLQEAAGEQIDKDSGLLHAAHRAWNALVVLELKLRDMPDDTLENMGRTVTKKLEEHNDAA